MLGFLVVPLLVLVPLVFAAGDVVAFPPVGWSREPLRKVLTDPNWLATASRSLAVASAVAPLAALLGSSGALALTRLSPRARARFEAFVIAPIVVPGLLFALGLSTTMQGLALGDSRWGLVLGHTVLATPLAVLVVSGGLRGVHPQLAKAAASLGAHPWAVFRTMTLPMMVPGVLIAALLSFIVSINDVIVALFLSGEGTQTFALQVFQVLEVNYAPEVAAGAALLVSTAAIALVIGSALRRWSERLRGFRH